MIISVINKLKNKETFANNMDDNKKKEDLMSGIIVILIAIVLYGMKYKNLNNSEKFLQFLLALFCSPFYILYVVIVYLINKFNK